MSVVSNSICPSRDDAQPHIYERGKCAMCQAPPKSWKPYVEVDREWVTNGLAFATAEEAKGNADHLMWRWIAVKATKAVESDEEVNYHWDCETSVLTNLETGKGRVPPFRVQL